MNRVIALAPQWAESQLRAEVRGYAQLAKAPIDLLRGKTRLGAVAQGQLNIVLGMLAAGQVINYLTTGHSTFENKDKARMLDAYIPSPGGKGKGFWFNPFEIGGEYAMMAHRYYAQHQMPLDIATRIMQNKLGPLARGVTEGITGHDYAGRKFENTTDRLRAVVSDIIPLPMPMTTALERDPRSKWLGFRVNRAPGQWEKQLLQMGGMKLENEMTPRSETFALAYPFREDQSYNDRASSYRELRRALDNDKLEDAEFEVRNLVKKGKTWDQLRAAVGIDKGGGVSPERFTGGTTTREREFIKSLTPQQREIYDAAQHDHKENAKKMKALLNRLRPELRDQLKVNEKTHQGKPNAE